MDLVERGLGFGVQLRIELRSDPGGLFGGLLGRDQVTLRHQNEGEVVQREARLDALVALQASVDP